MTSQVLIRPTIAMGDNNTTTNLLCDCSPSLGGLPEAGTIGAAAVGATTSSSERDSSMLLMMPSAGLSIEGFNKNTTSAAPEVGKPNALDHLLFPATVSPATQLNHQGATGATLIAGGISSSPKTAPSFTGRETGIVSHLRRNSSSSGSALLDIESALKANGQSADEYNFVNSTSISSSSLNTISPGGTNGHSIAMVPGNNNMAAAVAAANRYAALLLHGQMNRDAAFSQAVAMNNGMIMPHHPNMLLAACLGMGNFGNLTGFGGAVGVNPGSALDGRLVGASSMFGGSAGSSAVADSGQTMQRKPITLYMDCDSDSLSEYQCLIRQQIELFEADKSEATISVQGRNKQIVEGQVGIRCRHCATIPPRQRQKGSMYFPTKLDRIYQAAQNLSAFHLCENCKYVPEGLRKKILTLRERKSPAGGGKRYWGEGVRCLGVVEDQAGLRFR